MSQKEISLNQQPERIKSLFGSISEKYDLANDVMTFGLARHWRTRLVDECKLKGSEKILDCATGTGDLAIEFAKRVPLGEVMGTDFCEGMLEVAKRKNNLKNLKFETGDVTNLRFESKVFDVTSISYGIRNVEDRFKALKEMARVTKPQGLVMILETGETKNSALKYPIKFYFEKVVPRIGGLISGKRDAYEYLNKSTQAFPSREEFLDLMWETEAFSEVRCIPLLMGASYLYVGRVSR